MGFFDLIDTDKNTADIHRRKAENYMTEASRASAAGRESQAKTYEAAAIRALSQYTKYSSK